MPSRKLLLLQAAVDVGVAAASPQQPLFRTQSNSGTFEGAVSFSAFVFTTVTVFLLYAVYLSYFCRPRRQDDAAAGAVVIAADAVARERAERMRRCVEAMPVVAYAATAEKERCAICLGEYEDGEELRVLVQCKHAFHKKCVDRWLVSYAVRCPLCRRVVMTPVAGGGGGES